MSNWQYQKRPAALLHRRLLRYELDDLRQMSRFTTDLLQANLAARELADERAVEGLCVEDREAYFESRTDEYELFARHIPNQHQCSLVVMTYSMFESRLTSMALGLRRRTKPGWTGKRLPGNSSFESAKQVVKEANLPVPEELWSNLDGFRLVRNAIVHKAGEMKVLPPALAQLIAEQPNAVKLSSGQLVVKHEFVVAFTAACEALLNAVLDGWVAWEAQTMIEPNA